MSRPALYSALWLTIHSPNYVNLGTLNTSLLLGQVYHLKHTGKALYDNQVTVKPRGVYIEDCTDTLKQFSRGKSYRLIKAGQVALAHQLGYRVEDLGSALTGGFTRQELRTLQFSRQHFMVTPNRQLVKEFLQVREYQYLRETGETLTPEHYKRLIHEITF